ncbi:methyltransferase domain-containing protein [Clostridium manihotivorum]|uniref:SAM-dependent methyltransferase n=1 Tax=Clostridium manihotivorum TaxID=2320868 RepID=A0A410DT12_9CLOT|nr:methyltransferase domain-containing protein [Clostridium manihotivorum]QAA32254.1 SAM-dependent methyltransferase [Clostridium manihotivorum]
MDFRKVFNNIPEEFDKWRTRYCDEVFADIIQHSKLGQGKATLEIGPGTGQATEPILKTGCNYLAIELGEKLAEYTKNKFSSYDNFHIVNADFETYDFGHDQFDLVYSAATIQWIPEEIAFPKVYHMLKSNGTFAMMFTKTDEKSANELLYMKMQEVYDKYFHPETDYTCYIEYNNTEKYGFTDVECRRYHKTRELNADEYVCWISTHATHITLKEPDRSNFYNGIRDVILSFGNKITLQDTIVLYLARKP